VRECRAERGSSGDVHLEAENRKYMQVRQKAVSSAERAWYCSVRQSEERVRKKRQEREKESARRSICSGERMAVVAEQVQRRETQHPEKTMQVHEQNADPSPK